MPNPDAVIGDQVADRNAVSSSKRRPWLRRTSAIARMLLPWRALAWCEGMYFARFGEIELRMVRHLCRPDQDSIDVGANVGTYLHTMKRHSRRVYAFEPVPWLAQSLAKKFGQKVVVENVALSREASKTLLHIPVIDGATVTGLSTLSDELVAEAPSRDIPVETRPLDEVYAGTVGFIKIDVEGHEHSVLQGAQRTIARCQPRVLVEAEERHGAGAVRDVQAFFGQLGYNGYFVFQRRLAPIERFDPARMQRTEDIAGYAFGEPRARFERYVNNFLFLPREEPGATLTQLEAALTKQPASFRLWPSASRLPA
jgi:FkbM family methyltransferase